MNMSALALKNDILRLLALTDDVSALESIKLILKKSLPQNTPVSQDWWDELTAEEQVELELALQESFDQKNMVANEDVFKKYEAY